MACGFFSAGKSVFRPKAIFVWFLHRKPMFPRKTPKAIFLESGRIISKLFCFLFYAEKPASYTSSLNVGGLVALSRHLAVVLGGVSKYICIYGCMYIFSCTYVYTHIHIYIYTYLHIYIYAYMHLCIYTYIHIHIHIHMHNTYTNNLAPTAHAGFRMPRSPKPEAEVRTLILEA